METGLILQRKLGQLFYGELHYYRDSMNILFVHELANYHVFDFQLPHNIVDSTKQSKNKDYNVFFL